jgi:hypothetical protein
LLESNIFKFHTCENLKETEEIYQYLSLPMIKLNSLSEGFDNFLEKEVFFFSFLGFSLIIFKKEFFGENQYMCNFCNKNQDAWLI